MCNSAWASGASTRCGTGPCKPPCATWSRARGPAGAAPADGGGVAALQATIRDLRLDLRAAQVREEIALAMPAVLQRGGGRKSGAAADPGPEGRRDERRARRLRDLGPVGVRPPARRGPAGQREARRRDRSVRAAPSPSTAGPPAAGSP